MKEPTPMKRSDELIQTTIDSMSRGLKANAMWCSEMLAGMAPDVAELETSHAGVQPFDEDSPPADEGWADAETRASVLLQAEEYLRAAHCIQAHRERHGKATNTMSCKALFLCLHAKWLDGEASLQQSFLNRAALLKVGKPANPHSEGLYDQLSLLNAKGKMDAYLLYLLGLVLLDRGQKEDAMGAFLRAVVGRPLLWIAWKAVASVGGLSVMTDVERAFPNRHWAVDLFEAHLHLRNYSGSALSLYQALCISYPHASPVGCALASAAYDKNDAQLARNYYEKVLETDPYRIEDMDGYSTTLYMYSEVDTLSLFAHKLYHNQPYRPEVQCVFGNLYSLQKENKKAVNYFIRALQMDHRYHNAWTFLGHEYSPYQGGMGNVKGCIFAYNRALELDCRDYRAWLGLAQTYNSELNLPVHANYYAMMATSIRPNDERLVDIAAMIREKAESWHRNSVTSQRTSSEYTEEYSQY
ncbi:Anaphase-promoting complex subunit 8 [Diplonema papillatum]|nr:Anaphase-promoting complex subunit 8 [Diplonema papillatum]